MTRAAQLWALPDGDRIVMAPGTMLPCGVHDGLRRVRQRPGPAGHRPDLLSGDGRRPPEHLRLHRRPRHRRRGQRLWRNVVRTVSEFEAAGAAGIQLEDQGPSAAATWRAGS